jgi:hypothetical protein
LIFSLYSLQANHVEKAVRTIVPTAMTACALLDKPPLEVDEALSFVAVEPVLEPTVVEGLSGLLDVGEAFSFVAVGSPLDLTVLEGLSAALLIAVVGTVNFDV